MVTFPNSARYVRRITAPDSSSCPEVPTSSTAKGSADAVALLLALDTLELGFVFLSRDGQVQHASSSFRQKLEDSALTGLEDEVRRFAAVLWGLVNIRNLGGVVERLDACPMRLGSGECRLQGTYVGVDLFGEGASILIGVQLPPDDPFSAERLRERFGLTRKQSRVARLLGEGLRNDEIARRLFISPHTARHHIEQIKLKVGGHTRAAVASRILHADA